jgi:hypothetical protein
MAMTTSRWKPALVAIVIGSCSYKTPRAAPSTTASPVTVAMPIPTTTASTMTVSTNTVLSTTKTLSEIPTFGSFDAYSKSVFDGPSGIGSPLPTTDALPTSKSLVDTGCLPGLGAISVVTRSAAFADGDGKPYAPVVVGTTRWGAVLVRVWPVSSPVAPDEYRAAVESNIANLSPLRQRETDAALVELGKTPAFVYRDPSQHRQAVSFVNDASCSVEIAMDMALDRTSLLDAADALNSSH